MTTLLPEPFEWVDIPAGQTVLEDATKYRGTVGGLMLVPAFQISKYPVTVAQYQVFMDAEGYTKSEYWTSAGWQWREKEAITQPCYWGEAGYEKFFQPDHPIISVSWYEALAFCAWLSAETQTTITLPTDSQWQRAAQGDAGWVYPWGNEWDGARCNNSVSPLDSKCTTPVMQYPEGASPYGVLDMSGNVCEWCLTAWETGLNEIDTDNNHISRGGSYNNILPDGFRVAFRRKGPHNRWNFPLGFRLAHS